MSDMPLLRGIVPVIDAMIKNMSLPSAEQRVSFKLLNVATGSFGDCVTAAVKAVDSRGEALDEALLEEVAPKGDALAILFVDLFADYERTLGKPGANERLYIELKRVRRAIAEYECRLRAEPDPTDVIA